MGSQSPLSCRMLELTGALNPPPADAFFLIGPEEVFGLSMGRVEVSVGPVHKSQGLQGTAQSCLQRSLS